MSESCKDCKYYLDVSRYGICRRYPPTGRSPYNNFPVVCKEDWCGEFEEVGHTMSGSAEFVASQESVKSTLDEMDKSLKSLADSLFREKMG